jgi:hypothetical protein
MDTNEKNRQYILELFKIVGTNSILVVDPKGNVKRLYCPFDVIAQVELPPDIAVGLKYQVDAIKMTLQLKEVYIINGRAYFIWCFKIMP